MNWFLNSMLDLKHFCIKAYWNRNFMVTVYKFKKIVGRADFSDQFRKIIVRYKRIGYNKYNATVCMLSV